MPEIFILSTWIDAIKMKNTLNPAIKVDILQLQNNTGFILTVFEKTDKEDLILYRIPVECSLANNWSLSTEEAVIMLNVLGFPCSWKEDPMFEHSEKTYEQIKMLKALGWETAVRSIRPAEIYVTGPNGKYSSVSAIIPDYEYSDWKSFMTVNIPSSLDDLLSLWKSDKEDSDKEEDSYPEDIENTVNSEEIPTESE